MIATIFVAAIVSQLHAAAAFQIPSAGSALKQSLHHRPSSSSSAASSLMRRSRSAIIVTPTTTTTATTTSLHGLFGDDDDEENDNNEDDSIIPPELRDEIYAAEANTPAAQGRQARVVGYILLTLGLVTVAFFNAFLSDLRFGNGSPSTELGFYGFGWVEGNFLTSFLFMNKIGGGLGLLGAGLSGTLAEVEIRSRKENAEKIWTELQRRKTLKDSKPSTKAGRKKQKKLAQKSKRDMTGKQRKRMSALAELMEDDDAEEAVTVEEQKEVDGADASTEATETKETTVEDSKGSNDDGILGKIKGFYDQADSMAASQALLLNKELEDRGVLDKITDESGLKVIGKEQAEAEAVEKAKKD